MKHSLIIILLSLVLTSGAGEHRRTDAEPFSMSRLTVTAKSPEFRPAARKLAALLSRIYRYEVPVGENGNILFESAKLAGPQSYELQTSKSALIIRAASQAGALYAAADLLHELGYRRFSPDKFWEILPENPPSFLAVNKRETPDYAMRDIWPSWGIWPEYRKNGDHEAWHFANRTGGAKIQTGHAYDNFIRRNQSQFQAHPEYYALVKGKRAGSKLCIANPNLRRLFAADAVTQMRRNPDWASVSADPSDGGGWCECAECAKLGSPTDRAILLANEAAQAIQKEFPGKKVALYAYNQHSSPPAVAVDSNVIVNIATGFIREGWNIDRLLTRWGKCADIGIREYYNAGPEPGNGPGTNLAYLVRTIRDFHGRNARYITGEASDAWAPGLLGYNLAAQLFWNVNTEPEAFENDFYIRAFPKTEKPMRRFFALLDGSNQRPLSEDLLHRMYAALAEAHPLAIGPERARIEQLIAYTRFCELLFNHQKNRSETSYRALLESAAAVKPHYLVHTYAMFRDERQLGLPGKRTAAGFDWKTPRKLDYEKLLTEGMSNNKKLDFEPINFGYDLAPAMFPGSKRAGNIAPVRWKREFYLYSNGKPFTIKVTGGLIKHYRDRGNVKLDLIQIGGPSDTGEFETAVCHDESVPPDGRERLVTLTPKHPGLHRLVINDGGDMTKIIFPAELAVAVPVANESAPAISGDFWFYVPKGTRHLGLYAKTGRGWLLTPDGKRFQSLSGKNGFCKFDVPAGMDGQPWQVRGMNGTLRLLTVPDTLNLNGNRLLIPKKLIEKDRLK